MFKFTVADDISVNSGMVLANKWNRAIMGGYHSHRIMCGLDRCTSGIAEDNQLITTQEPL
jgi:hypothetical protein